MKKIVIASLALLSSLAFAASVTVEAQNQIGEKVQPIKHRLN